MTKWEARITYSAQEKGKTQEVQTRSSHFNEMLAEDANLLPDHLLSSLLFSLSLSLSSWRNSCRHTRRYEASGNTTKRIRTYKAGRSKRQYYITLPRRVKASDNTICKMCTLQWNRKLARRFLRGVWSCDFYRLSIHVVKTMRRTGNLITQKIWNKEKGA
jgi:hypothetical protein